MLAGTRIPGDGQQDSGEELGRIQGWGLEGDQDPRGRGPGSRGRGSWAGREWSVHWRHTTGHHQTESVLCSVSWGWGRGAQSYTNHLQLREVVKASADSNSDHRSTLELLADLGSSVTLCPVLRHSVLFCDTLSCSVALCPVL